MTVSKEKAAAICGSLLGLGTGIAANVGQYLVNTGVLTKDPHAMLYAGTAIVGGISINLLSNVAKDICSAFSKKVLIKHPDELNHDLQKTLLISIDQALDNVLILYKKQKPGRRNIKKALAFNDSVRNTLKQLFTEPKILKKYDSIIDVYLQATIEEAQTKIFENLQNEISATNLPKDFMALFEKRFTEQLRLCFAERLKDVENYQSWVAFQKMMLEGTKKDLEDLLRGQNQIIGKLDEIKKDQNYNKIPPLTPKQAQSVQNLLKEINQPARIQVQLNQALDGMIQDIRKELSEIKQLVSETYNNILILRNEISIHWWSRKLATLYAVIIVLIIIIITVRNYYMSQPFMVDVIIHGQKGINDLVLKSRGTVVLNYGDKVEKQTINENGEALFRQIPGNYRDDSSLITITDLEGDPYRPVCNGCKYKLEPGKTFYIELETHGLDKLSGVVVDEKGKPLKDATVIVQDLQATTDANGVFILPIPQAKQKRLQDIMVIKKGFKEEPILQVPPHTQSRPLQIQLQKN